MRLDTDTMLAYPKLQDLLKDIQTIGVDIDGILVDTVEACIRKASSQYQTVMGYDEWKHWNPHENTQLQLVGINTQERTVEFFHDIVHNPDWKIPPISGAVTGIQTLKDAKKTLIALTGRADDAKEVTTSLIETHFPGQIGTILLSNHDVPEKKKPKSQVAKENGIGLMIEDNIHYAIELAQNGVPTILLTRPWNQDAMIPDGLPIFRLGSWEEISGYI